MCMTGHEGRGGEQLETSQPSSASIVVLDRNDSALEEKTSDQLVNAHRSTLVRIRSSSHDPRMPDNSHLSA